MKNLREALDKSPESAVRLSRQSAFNLVSVQVWDRVMDSTFEYLRGRVTLLHKQEANQ